ncbi:MAG: Asp-tRNA(Asn)/Glu-tRNA(Gln) amidotransferase subunit GatC [Magnetospirillum sp.]|nr:Asp-tRNA(Asn)/Glu-tRNA(Gln) amidotransferase subunit GatC [Magnetospirillum sp.]
MSLDKATVRNIAELARIEVREDELDHLAGELSGILTFVEQLAEVNTDGVEPMASVAAITLPMRKDVVTDGGYAQAVLANAPDAIQEEDGGFFTVPKVVE